MVDTQYKILYYETGNIRSISWFDEYGLYHRDGDKPAVIDYYETPNTVMSKEYYWHGIHHREEKPAIKRWNINGVLFEAMWRKYGQPTAKPYICNWHSNGVKSFVNWRINRHGKPTMKQYDEQGDIIEMRWETHDEEGRWHPSYYHRVGKPAHLKWENGKLCEEGWYINNELHREDGPALRRSDKDSTLEVWYIDGKRHREGGPAYQYANDEMIQDEWRIDGKLHREDGPAFCKADGDIVHKEWYFNGKKHCEDKAAIQIWVGGILQTSKWYYHGDEYTPILTKKC
tara:strand:+ start:3867 stop:4724 length:858 start_codon:yes stop_codon:yes gene_type:complete